MKMSIEERIKTLEDKVSILESGSFGVFKAKEEPKGPYKDNLTKINV